MIFEKIRERLQKSSYEEYLTCEDVIRLDDAIKIICQVEAEYNNGWISVDDRLPEYNGKDYFYTQVIVQLKSGKLGTGCYRNKNNEWYGDFLNGGYRDITNEVIAWQPLPQPPKGE